MREPRRFLHQLAVRVAEGPKVRIERAGRFGSSLFEFSKTMFQLLQRDLQGIFLFSKKDGERDARNQAYQENCETGNKSH